MEKAKTFFTILGLGITIGVVLVIVLIFVVGARPQKVNVGGVEFEIPTPTPMAQVILVTEVPVIPPLSPTTGIIPTSSSNQTFDFGGQCSSVPVNLQDNLEVQLDPSRWYLIEEYDNQANPPIHIFRSQIGNISVTANAVRGLRAWECRGESEAFSQARLNAIGYKQNNPSSKVIGPDGQEVK
jgi:hypothetical protein